MAAGRNRALFLIAVAQLSALTLWFSASAVSDSLRVAWQLDRGQGPALTLSVQLGFVVGALGSAVMGVSDRVPTRRLFAVSAVAGAVLNGLLLTVGPGGFASVVTLRFLVGATLAGVYPTGMKAVAGWFRRGRGMAFGTLIGALTLGSATPHLIRDFGFGWRGVLAGASMAAVAGAALMLVAGDGPFETATSPFSWSRLSDVVHHGGFRLATIGYLGHMWELYAMWTWLAAFLVAGGLSDPSRVAFSVIGVGAIGALMAGRLADRRGRTVAAGGSMLVSGSMAALTPLVFGAPVWIALPVLAIWGVTVVADSAQFSAMVTEVVAEESRGTALTLQTALGFLLTLASIWLVPTLAEAASWRWAFVVLVPGPVIGSMAMVALRRSEWRPVLADGRG